MNRDGKQKKLKVFLDSTHTTTASLSHSLWAVVIKALTLSTAYVSVVLLEPCKCPYDFFIKYLQLLEALT